MTFSTGHTGASSDLGWWCDALHQLCIYSMRVQTQNQDQSGSVLVQQQMLHWQTQNTLSWHSVHSWKPASWYRHLIRNCWNKIKKLEWSKLMSLRSNNYQTTCNTSKCSNLHLRLTDQILWVSSASSFIILHLRYNTLKNIMTTSLIY